MSYCDFNNAFKNMNDKFLETFDGITSEDLSSNLVNSEDFYFDDENVKNSMQSNNEENLYGTSIKHLKNNGTLQNINNNGTLQNINNNKNLQNINNNKNCNLNKLTHRECIYLYLNPNDNKNPNYELAHRHVIICSLCQNEINKKVKESFEIVNSDNTGTNMVVDRTYLTQNINAANKTSTVQSNINTENKVVSLSMHELEVLLKNITDRTNNNDKTEHFSRIIQKLDENERNKPLCLELNFMNIAICLLIILLLIDIVLRLKK